jgi:methionyl-tRNA formyltransferase
VNDEATLALLRGLRPSVVVVHGTRVIAPHVLRGLPCPVVNLHAGITPGYRGVHGGYWALVEGRAELAGATVHVVDEGIDTGPVLAQATFAPTAADSIVTYPYLQLACGLPLLVEEVRRLLADGLAPAAAPTRPGGEVESRLRWHPTLWGYVRKRLTTKVR